MSAFDNLLNQIDAFIRKYYKDLMVKGVVLFAGILLLTFLLVVTLEFFGQFGSIVRAILFFGFLGTNLIILFRYIILPYLKLNSLGQRIDRLTASKIIGSFFPEISDRLINTLQLSSNANPNSRDYDLIQASVQQKSTKMKSIQFVDAINLGENKRYVAFVIPILLVVFSIGIFKPDFFKQSTERIVNFTSEYESANKFNYKLICDKQEIEEGENFKFQVELSGQELPSKVYVVTNRGKVLLKPITKNIFEGELTQVREKLTLRFEARNSDDELVKSSNYSLNVIGRAVIGKLVATIEYPKYLGMENEVIQNSGDLTVPEGSRLKWSVLAKNSSSTIFKIGEDKKVFNQAGFSYSKQVFESQEGLIVLTNSVTQSKDSSIFSVNVIKDAFPSIHVDEVEDSIKTGTRYFSGLIGDDYGLSNLTFVYSIKSKDGKSRKETLSVGRVSGTEMPFNFAVDFRKENIQLEDVVEYYFVVQDNDGIHKGKTTRSKTFVYQVPNLDEVNEKRDKENEDVNEKLKDVLQKANEFREDLDHLKNEMMNSNSNSWSQENQVNQLQEEQNSILDDLQQLKENIDNSIEEKNQLSEIDEDLLKQQEEINDLLEELMDDELKDLLEKLEELMKEQNKEEINKKMEELEMSNEDMKKQLERSMEMLKRLQVNEKIDAIEDQLKALAEEQENLKEEIEDNSGKPTDAQKEEQQKIEDAFEELKEDVKDLDSLNKELDKPMELGDQKQKEQEISNDLNEAKDKLDKNNSKKAGEKQKSAAEKMKEMASGLNEMQQQANQKQAKEDMTMLRNILESLVDLSLSQEYVMNKLRLVNDNDPAFKKYTRAQRRIISDTKIVEDSLYALAKRQPKIAKFIDAELNLISSNQNLALEDIDERRRSMLSSHQQYAMTSYNNLALMLNESLQDMQSQMKAQMPGSGSCDNPGGSGKPKPGEGESGGDDLKEMLKKQLEQMKQGMQEGGDKPGEKPGNKPGEGGQMGLGNKQLAKMAAEQGQIRRRLEQMKNELNKDGEGTGNKLNPLLEELKKQEKDLINKNLSNNLINRQREILTRLLESEKALMERGLDSKRESKEGKNENFGNQILLEEYKKEKLKQIELLRSVDPSYNKYYKDRANEYFNRM